MVGWPLRGCVAAPPLSFLADSVPPKEGSSQSTRDHPARDTSIVSSAITCKCERHLLSPIEGTRDNARASRKKREVIGEYRVRDLT